MLTSLGSPRLGLVGGHWVIECVLLRGLWDPHLFLLPLGLWGKTVCHMFVPCSVVSQEIKSCEVSQSWAKNPRFLFICYWYRVFHYSNLKLTNTSWLPRSASQWLTCSKLLFWFFFSFHLLYWLLVTPEHRTVCLCPFFWTISRMFFLYMGFCS